MTASDEVKYPVFLIDNDDYVSMLCSQADISSLELIDVQSEEYSGWDTDGRSVALSVKDGTHLVIDLNSTAGNPDRVRNAILHYAALAGGGRIFKPSRQDLPLQVLFDEVELFINEGRFFRRIKRFFKRE